ncbi:kinase [Herbaspirillum seropedicae]|uniref:GHMP family kinase ATP-binding protein n=1 Tax=Herbaspirillum seropedicae TaxID=964 RepID=UPI000848327E|nr:kinase [Herbaspirillum seropedicae]AON52591.1 galactokinase [Herbaspirillum seropedicae]MDR6395719.1 D-glycero-alpha-D-manno-heptose-7-phosphate kinase [Herbaspirillum seropedicae]
MIITRTPFRISFFGGGTDYPGWFREHGGAVLATTINKYCYITCRHLPPFFEHKHRIVYSQIENVRHNDEIQHPAVRAILNWAKVEKGVEIHHDGDLPARSGLGSSSAFTVGLLHALHGLNQKMANKDQLAHEAIHLEQNIIGENVGSQDQVSAAYGGFNRIEFHHNDSFEVSPVILPPHRQDELRDHLMLCFTGFSRIASEVAKSKIDNLKSREKELKLMHAMVDEALAILQDPQASIDLFGQLLDTSWQYKRSLSDRVSTPEIDSIYQAAMDAGAIGGKILGAGGGGFLLIFAKPERHAAIRERLNKLVHVPFDFDDSGSRVVLYQPNGL